MTKANDAADGKEAGVHDVTAAFKQSDNEGGEGEEGEDAGEVGEEQGVAARGIILGKVPVNTSIRCNSLKSQPDFFFFF